MSEEREEETVITVDNWYAPDAWNAIPPAVIASLNEFGVFYARVGTDGVVETVHPDQIVRVGGTKLVIDPSAIQINEEDQTITVAMQDIFLVEGAEAIVVDDDLTEE